MVTIYINRKLCMELGHMLPLNINSNAYMGSPLV